MSRVLDQAFDHPSQPEEHASALLAGGIMQHGYQCGMIWGATLAAGAQAFRLFGPGPQTEVRAILAANRLVESFRTQNRHINCHEITNLDKSSSTMQMISFFLTKGGIISCMRMAGRYARLALGEINAALPQEPTEAPSSEVSCAAMLARKMGMSDRHAVMLAGFAGGIGLCGGGCGALGAAIWINALNRCQEPGVKVGFNDPQSLAAIERFLKSTDYKFECSEIVGRKFESIDDHAAHLRNGGCSEIIEVLAEV
ncbi:MAG: C-GCAxxG-C-C family protein [bacterium]